LPPFDFLSLTNHLNSSSIALKDVTHETGPDFLHEENQFVEFDREPLIPHMLSTEGPALAVADINQDGREDVFVGSSKWKKSAVFIQSPNGKLIKSNQPALDQDSTYEDVDASWVDVNNDKHPDLVIASGGNEYYGREPFLSPRVYLNDGQGKLALLPNAFTGLHLTASCVLPADINGDGYMDLFIGGRSVPWNYGVHPRSYLLLNDKTGHFTDVTEKMATDLSNIGFVTNAVFADLDADGDHDLVLSLEWDGIIAFIADKGKFTKKYLFENKGWWNTVVPVDVDSDGDVDLVAGNLGENSRITASASKPVKMYYGDFDNNGKKEQVLTYYIGDREMPFANKAELEKQIPVLKKRFLYAEQFAKANLEELLGAKNLKQATTFTAAYFSNSVLINEGNWKFTAKPLPWQAQLTPCREVLVIHANNDSLPDLLLGGNYFDSNIQMGRYDADAVTLLMNKGNGNFSHEPSQGLNITGQVRNIRQITLGNEKAYILARNNDSLLTITFTRR
jgi:hypothetical protein